MRDKSEASERQEREYQTKIKEHERKYADLEAKVCAPLSDMQLRNALG